MTTTAAHILALAPKCPADWARELALALRESRRDPLAEAMLYLDVDKGAPSRTVTVGGQSYKLSSEEYESMKRELQQLRWQMLTPIVQGDGFRALMQSNPLAAQAALEREYVRIGSAARQRWLLAHPEVLQKVRAAKPKMPMPSPYLR